MGPDMLDKAGTREDPRDFQGETRHGPIALLHLALLSYQCLNSANGMMVFMAFFCMQNKETGVTWNFIIYIYIYIYIYILCAISKPSIDFFSFCLIQYYKLFSYF
jgi:hypothetical protein